MNFWQSSQPKCHRSRDLAGQSRPTPGLVGSSSSPRSRPAAKLRRQPDNRDGPARPLGRRAGAGQATSRGRCAWSVLNPRLLGRSHSFGSGATGCSGGRHGLHISRSLSGPRLRRRQGRVCGCRGPGAERRLRSGVRARARPSGELPPSERALPGRPKIAGSAGSSAWCNGRPISTRCWRAAGPIGACSRSWRRCSATTSSRSSIRCTGSRPAPRRSSSAITRTSGSGGRAAAYRDPATSYVQTGIAIDPHRPDNGAMTVLPGSHKLGELSFGTAGRVMDRALSDDDLQSARARPGGQGRPGPRAGRPRALASEPDPRLRAEPRRGRPALLSERLRDRQELRPRASGRSGTASPARSASRSWSTTTTSTAAPSRTTSSPEVRAEHRDSARAPRRRRLHAPRPFAGHDRAARAAGVKTSAPPRRRA